MQIGQRVEVTGPGDETFDERYIGQHGTISSIDIDGGRFPVGQMASDPFYGVNLDNGSTGNFWTEEMKKLD